jgi:hypothetical protein
MLLDSGLTPDETPEQREVVTDADVEAFIRSKEEAEKMAASLGGFMGGRRTSTALRYCFALQIAVFKYWK